MVIIIRKGINMNLTEITIYWIGYFIVLVGIYFWNKGVSYEYKNPRERESKLIPFGGAIIISLTSWILIGLVLMFGLVGGITWALLENPISKKIDEKFFK